MINNRDIKVSYRGNGQTTVFPFSFPFIKAEYIHVAIYDSLTQTTRTLTSDYYVDSTARTVTYPGYPPGQAPAEQNRPPVLPSTSYITIYRQTDIDQLIDLGDKYPLPDIESMSDKLTEILQEHDESLARAIKVPIGDPETPEQKYLNMQTYVAETKASAAASAASAAAALNSKNAAAASATAAANSKNAAAASAAEALNSKNAAAASAAEALSSKNAAANSKNAAAMSATSAINSAQAAAQDLQSVRTLYTQTDNARNQAQAAAANAADSQAAAENAAATATSQAGAVGTLASRAENILAGYAAYDVPPWSSTTEYSYPAVVSCTDGNTYRCIDTPAQVGVAPPSSNSWVRITTRGGDDFFDIDVWGGLMPSENPTAANEWTLDSNGDIMPKDASDNTSREAKTIAEEALEEAQALRTEAQAAISRAETALNNIPMELDSDGNVTPVEEEENNDN